MLKLLAFRLAGIGMLMDKVPDPAPAPPTPADPAKEIETLKAEKLKLEQEIAGLKAPPKKDDPSDLAAKAAKEREEKEVEAKKTKSLEGALNFTIKAADWLKTNATLLPKTLEGIFAQAEKEVYANAIDKAAAMKSGIISEFFAIQSNQDLLTAAQKNALADFKALTKNDKEQRVNDIWDNIFEPTFESLKRIKKAEQVRQGLGDPSSSDSAYEKKIKEASAKHYLRTESKYA